MDGANRCQYPFSRQNDRFTHKNPVDSSNDQSKSTPCARLPAKPAVIRLISNKTLPSSSTLPQERESWIHSVKRTKINENAEQKTQYLETMIRLQSWIRSVGTTRTNQSTEQQTECSEVTSYIPQRQKSSTDLTTFDRVRFADQQIPTITNTTENNNQNNLDPNNDDEITLMDVCSVDNEPKSSTKSQATNGGSTLLTDTDPTRWSGFLIDNCDEVESSPISPPSDPTPQLSPPTTILSVEQLVQQNEEDLNRQREMLVYEFDTADAEQKQQTNRQKQLTKRLQKKKKLNKPKPAKPSAIDSSTASTAKKKNHYELPADWIVEYDASETDQTSQLIEKTSAAVTVGEKSANINTILEKMKQKQRELKELRDHVLSLLNEEPKSNSTDINEQDSSNNQDLLMHLLNQSTTSGCWLCSGKTYFEVATQCNT